MEFSNKNSSYVEQIQSKNAMNVSVFTDGKTFYSRYNPQHDAEIFCENEIFENSDFFLIAGLGNGYHIQELVKKFPKKKILVLEDNSSSIETLFFQNQNLKSFLEKNEIKVTTIENLENDLVQNYLPAIYSNFSFVAVRSWENFHSEKKNLIVEKIEKALKIISDDYSVQCRFGKIWQKNITSNINFIKNSIKFNKDFIISKNKKKYAAIIAAGPSLDKDIENLKKYSNFLSIVATDTSFPVLLENQIVPDFVVSIDAQIFSHEHFIINWKKFGNQIREKTVFVLDFCCNSSLTKKLVEQNCNILFFKSGHPLAEKICEQIENQIEKKNCNADNTKFLSLTNGRGTVTSTCFSFCEKMNFENVIFFGADFSFFQNKPYCKSTYLEKNWLSSSSKIESQELQNTKLMYRGKVDKIKNSNIYTTQLLEEYKNEQIRMIEKSDIKNVFCSSENPNNMTLNVLKYDNLSYFQKHDNKYDLKYDNKSLLKYDIKYDINYDILPNFVFLPLKAWQKAKNIESNKT